jgi:hypothetical protein
MAMSRVTMKLLVTTRQGLLIEASSAQKNLSEGANGTMPGKATQS